MKKTECFKIIVYEQSSFPYKFDLSSAGAILKIESKNYLIKPHPTIITADPFLFVQDETLFLFYEKQTYWNPGTIEMICTRDLKKWTNPKTVLKETCHLSYPYVFEYDGSVYMIPETSKLGEIRLYKSNETLTSFKYVKTLISDIPCNNSKSDFADSSLLFLNDTVYLFSTTTNNSLNYELRLFFSDNIMGQFQEHPKSPIIIGNKYGRNGGGVIEHNGKIFRISQDCKISYGNDINIFEITDISKTDYRERIFNNNIFSKYSHKHPHGGHHLSIAEFHKKYIMATDAKDYHVLLLAEAWNTIGNQIRRFLK